jgi:hypothetical protein
MTSERNFLQQFQTIDNLPDALIRLADYVNLNDEWICDFGFVLDGKKWSEAWFDSDLDTAKRFAVFGRTKGGGLFAFWKQLPQSLSGAPIVYLASECVGSTVVASNLRDWLSCIAFGSNDYELDIQYALEDEWEGPEDNSVELQTFREWCKKTLDVDPTSSPSGVIRTASQNSPSVIEYIERWQAMR